MRQQLESIIGNDYQPDKWKQLISMLLPHREFFVRPENVLLDGATKARQESSEEILRIGQVSLADHSNVGIYQVKLKPGKQIGINRVNLRSLVSQEVSPGLTDGALVSFYDPKQPQWRFSFISKSYGIDEEGNESSKETHPKRYTYVFGKTEKNRTALDRLTLLGTKDTSLKNLLETFSVEKISKDFFKEYREIHYNGMIQYLTGEDIYGKAVGTPSDFLEKCFNKDKKAARNFCKKTLGRIVFLYFLQKKGWLGVAPDQVWGKGDRDFMSNLFKQSGAREDFYPKYLSPLFFNTLNTKRPNDECELVPGKPVKIPYLNGGLFESESANLQSITFPPAIFSRVFECFDRYNFTVLEDDPDEQQVAVDPEMLGHIFENLLEDNRDKGSFYTPKEVVQYMCQESLIEHLCNKLPVGKGTTLNRPSIEQFIRLQEAGGIIDYDEAITKALKDVKICDPAIGSGAFPMGILQEIFRCFEYLYAVSPDVVGPILDLKDGWQPAKVKLDIIQNSIYGVDKDKGAVDIARLRFWLAIIVDETEPTPLPNLDYKVMQGDSLLESFQGIDLSIVTEELNQDSTYIKNGQLTIGGGFADPQLQMGFSKERKKKLKQLVKEYFNRVDSGGKKQYNQLIDQEIAKHISAAIKREEKILSNG